MKIAIYTLGCKVNQADSQSIQEMFIQAGCEIVAPEEQADVYIINTCVVTNVGQNKSKQTIRRFIRNNPQALIVVTGCYPQTAEQEVKQIEGVHLIVGNQNRAQLVTLVLEQMRAQQPQQASTVDNIFAVTDFEQMPTGTHTDKTRAFLKIQEGCNQFCSYCIIPYARGRLRSRSLEDIRTQVELLTRQGFHEVVLLGIHLGAYGKELNNSTGLADAVQAALSVPELQRLRLGSLECIEIDDTLLELMAMEPRLAKHLHLPLQSGSDNVLKAMNRPYTTAEFRSLLEKIRQRVPDIALTTDVIVGFPGETAQEFEETYRFCQSLGFAKMHIFPFSKRQGTPAETMPNQLSKFQKQERATALGALDETMQTEFLQQFIGSCQTVLIEQQKDGIYSGYTSNYIRIYISSQTDITNQMLTVQATELYKDGLRANIV